MFTDIYALLHMQSYTENEIVKINIKHMQKQRISAQVGGHCKNCQRKLNEERSDILALNKNFFKKKFHMPESLWIASEAVKDKGRYSSRGFKDRQPW